MSSYVFIILTTFQYMMAGIHLDVQLYDKVCTILTEVWQARSAWNIPDCLILCYCCCAGKYLRCFAPLAEAVVLHYILNFVQQHESFDDVITVTYLWRHLLFSVTLRWKIKTSPILLKFSVGGRIEMLIVKMGWDWKLTMILVEKLQFPTDFSHKFNKHSSTIALPWQHWVYD